MPYIGNTPTTQSFISGTDYFSGTGSQTAYTLTRTVNSVNDIEVVINNVVQQPSTAYTLSGTTITFTSAPSSGTNNIYVRYLSTTLQSFTVPNNSVGTAQLTSDLQNRAYSMKNRIINGSFDIWQRGTSIASSGATYTTDRWYLLRDGNASGSTCSQTGATNTIFTYGAKVQRDNGNSGTGNLYFAQPFETNVMAALRGSYVTVSFYVKAGANFSGSNLKVHLVSGTGSNSKYWGGGFTNATALINGTTISISPTQSYQSITTAVVVPTNATQLELSFVYTPTGTASADDSYTIEGVQLEAGSVATPFETRLYGTELALCQRYYEKIGNPDGESGAIFFGITSSTASTSARGPRVDFKVTKRAQPTMSLVGSLYYLSGPSWSSIDFTQGTTTQCIFPSQVITGGSGGTAYTLSTTAGANNYISASAEL